MKKILLLIVGILFATNLFAVTYTFNLNSVSYVGGIKSPSYGSVSHLTSRAQNITISLHMPAGFSVSQVSAVKQSIQTLLETQSNAGVSITNAQLNITTNTLVITLAITENNSGNLRTIDFTFTALGVQKKITYSQTPKTYYRISPSKHYVLPYRPPYTVTLSGSGVGRTYSLYKNGSLVSSKPGTGSALTFQVTYTAPSAGFRDTYTVQEGDNEFRSCTMTYYNEIAKKQYQAPQASYEVDPAGGDVIVRCEWPGYENIGMMSEIIERMNDGSYAYAWDNQNATISIVDYDLSSFCILMFKFTANNTSGSRTFEAPFLFNNGKEVTFSQRGDNPLKNAQNWRKLIRYTSETGDSKQTTIEYFDGLARPIQQVRAKAAADQSNKDVINIIQYDAMGRNNATSYLPFAKKQTYAGGYVDDAAQQQQAYYEADFNDDGAYAFVENEFEKSPLNRILSRTNVGKVYRDQQKQTQYTYATNDAGEVLQIVADSAGIGFSVDGYFPESTLYKNTTTDEDGSVSIGFYDADGQLVLQRKVNENNNLDTYYAYNELGNVTHVIAPQASQALTDNTQYTVDSELFADYCYGYKYDHRGSVIEKKLPGKAIELSVYDNAGRLVMYQDGVMRASNQWEYTVYDTFDNAVMNRMVTCANPTWNRTTIDQKFNAEPGCRSVDYQRGSVDQFLQYAGFDTDFPTIALLKLVRYCRLGQGLANPVPNELAFIPVANIVSWDDRGDVRGNKLCEKILNLNSGSLSGSSSYTQRAFYYDIKGRLIQMVEQHPNKVLNRYSYKYDFVGNVIATQEAHTVNGRTDSLNSRHNIYNVGQLTSSVRNLNNSIEATINYNRDELGRMASKDYGSAANNLTETYKYNIQGWLTEQSTERFSSTRRYYNPKRGAAPSYTGQITEWEWTHPELYMSGSNSPEGIMPDSCCYLYTYDNLSQLKQSQLVGYDPYFDGWLDISRQNEAMTYDRNGNIATLQRQDMYDRVSDNFTYTYTGNQLTTLKNSALTYAYAYDANGNMTIDGLNTLQLQYNFLNLVAEVGDQNNIPKARYTYLADGTKIGVKDRLSRNGFEYYGSFRYAVVNGVTKLESVPYEGGRIIVSVAGSGASAACTYSINAYTTDHLNSVRGAKYNAFDSAFEDYYPFGKGWENPAYSSNFDKYTYNGKEMQTTGWLPYLDYGARMYDPRIGRWFGPDPLAEKYYSTSPYAFCANNPINRIDLDGMEWQPVPGGAFDPDRNIGSINAVSVIHYNSMTARLWFAFSRLRYSNYGPTNVPQSPRLDEGHGGAGGSESYDDKSSDDEKKKPWEEKLQEINEKVKKVNDPVGVILSLDDLAALNRALSKLSDASKRVGIATAVIDAALAVNNYADGKPWGGNAVNAGIGIIGIFGPTGAMASFALGQIKNGVTFLMDQYNQFEEHANEWMMTKIVPGYRP